jgi:hypothetical protein
MKHKNTDEILKKYSNGDFKLWDFKCKIDDYDNAGYIKNQIPKRLYIDIIKGGKCCFVYANFGAYCADCIKDYGEQLKKEKARKW